MAKSPEIKAVEAEAEIRQIKTMVDHSVNVTLNLPEYCKEQVKVLFDWQGEMIKIVLINDD